MEGWLPRAITDVRRKPSGFSGAYFSRAARREMPQLVTGQWFSLVSDETGLIIALAYRESEGRFDQTGTNTHLNPLVFTALVESWHRGLT